MASLFWPKRSSTRDTNEIYHTLWSDSHLISFYDMDIFSRLHKFVCHVLVLSHRGGDNTTPAKTFLQEQLGSCHDILRTVLRRIVAGELWAPDPTSGGHCRWSEIEEICDLLKRFMNCLSPLPMDRETKALIRRARIALLQVIVAVTPTNFCLPAQVDDQCIQIHHAHRITACMNIGRRSKIMSMHLNQHNGTDSNPKSCRGQVLCLPLDPIGDLQRLGEEHETSKTSTATTTCTTSSGKKYNSGRSSNSQDQKQHQRICANCGVSKKQLLDQCSGRLMDCSNCLNVAYCSRACQLEHWKTGHRKHCKTMMHQS
jgi:MYND finger